MKTKQFTHGFFMLLILSVIMVSFNSCDKDDDNDDGITFLESYEGTKWALEDDGGIPEDHNVPDYFRVVNDSNKIIEGWYLGPECYYFIEGFAVVGDQKITENSENKLVVKITYSADDTDTFTCTIQGDILKVVNVYKDAGWPDEVYNIFYNKTTVDVDSLPICPL